MTRDELLNHLRRQLSNRQWSSLQPDQRLNELEAQLNTLVERLESIRADYCDEVDADLFGALDDLAASLSYLRSDVGHFFSDATRLSNELRRALERLESDESVEQMYLEAPAEESAEEATEEPEQARLF